MVYKIKLYLLISIPLLAIAGLDGKEVYGDSTLDNKVEKYQRHNENPFGDILSKKKTIQTTQKNLNDLKKEIKKQKITHIQSKTKKKLYKILEEKRKKFKRASYEKIRR